MARWARRRVVNAAEVGPSEGEDRPEDDLLLPGGESRVRVKEAFPCRKMLVFTADFPDVVDDGGPELVLGPASLEISLTGEVGSIEIKDFPLTAPFPLGSVAVLEEGIIKVGGGDSSDTTAGVTLIGELADIKEEETV